MCPNLWNLIIEELSVDIFCFVVKLYGCKELFPLWGVILIFTALSRLCNDLPAELLVNGEIVKRSPERERRVQPVPQRAQDRPRYNDRTRYNNRRQNMR